MNSLLLGLILLLIGLLIILNTIFGISIPIVPLIFGILFIYFGIKCLIPRPTCSTTYTSSSSWSCSWNSPRTTVFNRQHIHGVTHPEPEYNTVFGESTIDLSTISMPSTPTHIKINTVFSNSTLIINPAIPTLIKLNVTMGHANIPHEVFQWIGNNHYTTAQNNQHPVLIIDAQVVFSNLNIKNI